MTGLRACVLTALVLLLPRLAVAGCAPIAFGQPRVILADAAPDTRIRFVLHGWRDDGKPAQIDLTHRDLHVGNLPTNIRDWQGGTEVYGSSIFLFESAGVCIAHLSHLHHLLTEQDLVLPGGY